MSVVKINAITVPEGMGPQLEERFANRARMVEGSDGFEDFQLLRPVEGETRYFVYTRWSSEEHFQAWMNSQDFAKGHANAAGSGGPPAGHGGGHAGGGHPGGAAPVSQSADLLSFEVVEHVVKQAD
jgi:heme-degrading monooxygenase HmoA